MIEAVASPPARQQTASADAGDSSFGFRDILSALNPLQYLPVVGTIYRAATGDAVADPVRRVGSAIGSFLMGGPVGLALNLATTAAEKISGINLDETAQSILKAVAAPFTTPPEARPADATPRPWSAVQLAAYGVRVDSDGGLARGDLTGADVLNALELDRVRRSSRAYAQTLDLQFGRGSAGLG